MTPPPNRHQALLADLLARRNEEPWLEFKRDNIDPQLIGKLTSALSNAARTTDQPFGYVVWGVDDKTRAVVGTSFEPKNTRKGNQPLELWLAQQLDPSPAFEFIEVAHPAGGVVLLQVPAATTAPVRFEGRAYTRIGEATPLLADYPERERLLWTKLQPVLWERGVAAQYLSSEDVLERTDYPECFRLLGHPLPESRSGVLQRLADERVLVADVGDRWSVSNLGALLFARQLDKFDRLGRKAVRVIQYDGTNRVHTKREQVGAKGYAVGFEGLIAYIDGLLPRNEHIEKALRVERPTYPEIAVRELVANALIHQDLTVTGAGPMVELFDDRVEITNPGAPLIEVQRFIGSPPRSRNEDLAALMRRMRFCEERGSGITKVLTAIELFQLPPPDFQVRDGSTRTVLFAPRTFLEMSSVERIRACYQHAALRSVSGLRLTNASFRQRLGVEERNAAQVSRIIKSAVDEGLIKPADNENVRAGYLPWWG